MVLSNTDMEKIKGVIINTFNENFFQEVAQRVGDILDKRFEERFNEQMKTINVLDNTIQELKHKCIMLEKHVDNQEQSSRNLNVRIFGILEEDGKSLRTVILDLFNKKLKLKLADKDIKKCYRVNTKNNQRPSAVLVRFDRDRDRLDVLKNRKQLKGCGVFIKEDLTKFRLSLLEKAVRKFTNKNAWCLNGNVYVKCNGEVHRIMNDADIDKLPN